MPTPVIALRLEPKVVERLDELAASMPEGRSGAIRAALALGLPLAEAKQTLERLAAARERAPQHEPAPPSHEAA